MAAPATRIGNRRAGRGSQERIRSSCRSFERLAYPSKPFIRSPWIIPAASWRLYRRRNEDRVIVDPSVARGENMASRTTVSRCRWVTAATAAGFGLALFGISACNRAEPVVAAAVDVPTYAVDAVASVKFRTGLP